MLLRVIYTIACMVDSITAVIFFGRAWNNLDKQDGITLSGGNLIAVGNSSISDGVRGTNSKDSGKHYFEVTLSGAGDASFIGIASSAWDSSTQLASDTNSACYVSDTATGYLAANEFNTFIAVSKQVVGDVIGVAVDVSNSRIYWSKNNVWQNAASPSTGTGWVSYVTTSPVYPAFFTNAAGRTATLAVSTLTYSPPSGFTAWN